MKQQFLLLITLLMIASQSFAQGIKMDSLSRGQFVESDRRLGGGDESDDTYNHDPSGYDFIDGDFLTADFIVPVDTENGTNSCSRPTVIVIPPNLYFNRHYTKSFYLMGRDLHKSLSLRLAGTGKASFSLSRTWISKSEAGKGVSVDVTCNPTIKLQKAIARVEVLHDNEVVAAAFLYYTNGGLVEIDAVPMPEDEDAAEENVEETAAENSQEVWGNAVTGVEELSMSARVYADGQNIVIESPVEQSAIISDISGRAQRVNLMAGINVIPASTSGIHIVKVGEKTVKLMLR